LPSISRWGTIPQSTRIRHDLVRRAEQIVDDIKAIQETKKAQQRLVASAVGFNRLIWKGAQDIQAFHEEWLNFADSGDSFQLLAARDHFKTTVITLNYTLYRIIKDPNVQVLLVSESAGQAHKWSRYIRFQIEERYPWLSNRNLDKWTDRLFTVPRTREESKDSTVEAVGMLGRIVGGHFDLAVIDDVCSLENTRSNVMREHVDEWLKQVVTPAMVPGSQTIVVGSAWHYDDQYVKNEKEGWTTYKYPAIKEGKILFPSRYTQETLDEKRLKMGAPYYNCQFLLDPKGLIGRLLKEAWLTYYDPPEPPDLEIVQGVDPAFSETTSADYLAIATVGYSPSLKTMYLLDIKRFQADFPTQLDNIEKEYAIWKPSRIIVESNAFGNMLIIRPLIKSTLLPIIPRKTVKDKVTRMLRIAPYFESKRLQIRRVQQDFISEYVEFPDSAHDDQLDALELAVSDIIGRHLSGAAGGSTGGGTFRSHSDDFSRYQRKLPGPKEPF
jgi:predicted phage terminase large subunit-like protein